MGSPLRLVKAQARTQSTAVVQARLSLSGKRKRSDEDDDAVVVCKDTIDFMRGLPDESMKLIITSPPYNLGKEYETKQSLEAYISEQSKAIKEAVRLLHPNGSICWQIGNYVDGGEIYPLDILLYPVFKGAGLKLRNRIIWSFGHGLHCQKRFSGRYETILWFTKTEDYTFNLDDVRVASKYPNKKHFKGPNKGKLSGNRSEEHTS